MSTCACARFSFRNAPTALPSEQPELEQASRDQVRAQRLGERTSTTAPISGPVTVPMPPMMQMRTTCTEMSRPKTCCGSMKPT